MASFYFICIFFFTPLKQLSEIIIFPVFIFFHKLTKNSNFLQFYWNLIEIINLYWWMLIHVLCTFKTIMMWINCVMCPGPCPTTRLQLWVSMGTGFASMMGLMGFRTLLGFCTFINPANERHLCVAETWPCGAVGWEEGVTMTKRCCNSGNMVVTSSAPFRRRNLIQPIRPYSQQ